MKRHDLATQTTPQTRETDVAIVGAGIAGFFLAKRLNDLRVPCLLLESGGAEEQVNDHLYHDVVFRRRTYRGATDGRSRCLGGTSIKWGGALLPFSDTDFAPRRHARMPDWPIQSEDLTPYIRTAERLFGLDHKPYEADLDRPGMSSAFIPREAKWPNFSNRNVATLFSDIANGRGEVDVWINATVRDFDIRDGKIVGVSAQGPGGQNLAVTAKRVVLCAGAIETTRLMLLLDAQTKQKVVTGRTHLGRYFQDHLSLPLARIETSNPKKLNALFGFRFDGPVMRSLRFEQGRAGETAGFVHIAPRSLGPTGFDSLRDFMRSIQKGSPNLWALFRSLRDAPFVARLVWWRLFKKRLLWPTPAEYDVHFVIEQLAVKENQITLGEGKDALGHQVCEIDWDISEDDVIELDRFRNSFEKFWRDSGFSSQGDLVWTAEPRKMLYTGEGAVEGIYHPSGTTRMAQSPKDGVVDRNLQVFGVHNLYLGSTSVFPNGGSSNPTMTLILLILRLADHLLEQRISK